jgi:hypothetical protein
VAAIAVPITTVPATGWRKYTNALPVRNMTTVRTESSPAASIAEARIGLPRTSFSNNPA